MAAVNETSPLLLLSHAAIAVQSEAEDNASRDHASVATELKELLELAYPVVVTTTMEFLPGITSTIQAGHLHSPFTKEYVDAATLSTMFTNITGYSIGFGLASALDTLCSQAFGAKRFDKIGVYFQSGLLVVGVCLAPVALVNWYTATFLRWMRQDHGVADLAQVYSRYSLMGVPFVFLYELQRKALQAQGIMTPLIAIAVLGNVVQIASGYVLAYHTSWGFAGVAVARSLGNVSLPVFLWLYYQLYPHHLYQWWNGWRVSDAVLHVGLFLRLGVPGMLMIVMEWWAFEMLSLMAGTLPDPVVAMSAQSVQINVTSLFYVFYLGFSVAANIRVGNHLGAGLPKRARAVMRLTTRVVTAMGVGFGLIMFSCRELIAQLFVDDPVTIARASSVLAKYAPVEVIEGLNCVLQGVFRGAGKQDAAARINLVTFYGVGMPLAYVAGFDAHWGVEGLWSGFGVALLLSASTLLMTSSRWDWQTLADDARARTAENPALYVQYGTLLHHSRIFDKITMLRSTCRHLARLARASTPLRTQSYVRTAASSTALQTLPIQHERDRCCAVPRRAFCSAPTPPSSSGDSNDAPVLPPGAESPGDKFVMIYTCAVCNTRAAKTISKHAYYNGVVLVRCPGCEKLHLIADRLGWFDDESTDVESILAAKGEHVRVVTHENVLELTDADIAGWPRQQQ